MKIVELHPQPNWVLSVIAEDGRVGSFDVRPYLECEAFEDLQDTNEFIKVTNGGYYVEWDCGADLSADSIEAKWHIDHQPYQPRRVRKLLYHLPTRNQTRRNVIAARRGLTLCNLHSVDSILDSALTLSEFQRVYFLWRP